MWVSHSLKAPEEEPWVALTRVDSEGSTRSLGYLPPETLRLVALHVKARLELHDSEEIPGEIAGGVEEEALRDFADWALRVAELKAPEPAVKPAEPVRRLAPGPDGFRRVFIDEESGDEEAEFE